MLSNSRLCPISSGESWNPRHQRTIIDAYKYRIWQVLERSLPKPRGNVVLCARTET